MPKSPKILLLDIETAPMLAYVWGLFDQNVGLNQIKADWHALSWAAKWHDPEGKIKYPVMYQDQRNVKNIEDDSKLLKQIWKLIDEADFIIGQNSNRFDLKKLNARFILNGMQPPSGYKKIDTLNIARKHFAFSSNKLEYLSDKLCTNYKKLKSKKFQGFELWKACLSKNKKAWSEMELYNKYDVLALEELYRKLVPWDNSINFNVYNEGAPETCKCGSTKFKRNGYHYTDVSKFQRFRCDKCGAETRSRVNEIKIKPKTVKTSR